MRFMIIVKATKDSEAGMLPPESLFHAMEWARRFPNPALGDGEIEVRQLFELEDFPPSEAIDRFRKMEGGAKK